MAVNFSQDWPVFILTGGVIYFIIYVIINSRQQERKNKEGQGQEKDKKPR